uniref:Uncharacterized protein n=1 Tax=uncultured marine group II/III euryarchaeote KM3_99_A09 TaxID=1456549 RepID=A0A075HY35_9EURY|nr:hypothetical protein [uncultured marine group II/III euryarchaeote KM3_99_A09]
MVTITPVINEKHGSIERQAMAGQMTDLALETVQLSESGLPGDSASMPLRPHTGELGWDYAKGGTWYSVAYTEDGSLRFDDLLDVDDDVRIRYPAGEISAVCFSDLRASGSAIWNYRLPATDGIVQVTPQNTLQLPLDVTKVIFSSSSSTATVELADGDTSSFVVSSDSWIRSDGPLRVMFQRGVGGATLVEPDLASPDDGTGRYWTVPLPAGIVSAHFVSDSLSAVDWSIGATTGSGQTTGIPAQWSNTWTATAGDVLTIETGQQGRLLLVWGNSNFGATMWPDVAGAYAGTNFVLPDADGSVLIENMQTSPISIQIAGLYQSVTGDGVLRIDWQGGASTISSSGAIQVHWLADTAGSGAERAGSLELIAASDTGQSSGTAHSFQTPESSGDVEFILQPATPDTSLTLFTSISGNVSPQVTFNDTTFSQVIPLTSSASGLARTAVNETDSIVDGPYRLIASAGDDGWLEVRQDGEERCIAVGNRASGWMQLLLPWENLELAGISDVREAWLSGSHPLGIGVSLFGPAGNDPHSSLASAWGAHLPRLNYRFESSVSNMEIGFRGGFVGTNHPEFHADVLVQPPSREGPGPRLAVTIPLTLPTTTSSFGAGDVQMTIELDQRSQLASVQAHEIRRGWDGPYGAAIAADVSAELAYSVDWLTFPGDIDRLDDYVGWVQLTHSNSEAIYHAAGEPILFNLQLAQLSMHTESIS